MNLPALSNRQIETVFERIESLDKPCVYLCGPHLEPCTRYRKHKGDCRCSNIFCESLRTVEHWQNGIKPEDVK